MELFEVLKRMFLERNCVICESAISYDDEYPFCEKCALLWHELLGTKCARCGREVRLCSCMPTKIKKINHSVACWCVFYNPGPDNDINKLFSILKKEYCKDVIKFCGELMAKSLLALAKARGIKLSEYAVTYAPRRSNNVLNYGFDQSKKLAGVIAKKLKLELITTVVNNSENEQKGLSKAERAKNAFQSYCYIDGSLKENKKLILVDDIITTGATMYACAYQLFKNGAAEVIPVAFAKDNYKVKSNCKIKSKYKLKGKYTLIHNRKLSGIYKFK